MILIICWYIIRVPTIKDNDRSYVPNTECSKNINNIIMFFIIIFIYYYFFSLFSFPICLQHLCI